MFGFLKLSITNLIRNIQILNLDLI